jgi:lysozyme family protein
MADFKPAFAFVLQHEDPTRSGKVTVDAGGRTRFGIAEKFHPGLTEEFFSGPGEDALGEAERIEERDYWEPMRLAEVENQNVANKLFDMAVNMGVRQASIYAQRAANVLLGHVQAAGTQAPDVSQRQPVVLARLEEDGEVGEKTLAAIHRFEPRDYHQLLCELSEAHYRHIAAINPAQAVNLHGWLKRANA